LIIDDQLITLLTFGFIYQYPTIISSFWLVVEVYHIRTIPRMQNYL